MSVLNSSKHDIKKLKYYNVFSNINHMESESVTITKYFVQIWRGLFNYCSNCKRFCRTEHVHCSLYLLFIETLVCIYDLSVKIILMKHGRMLKISKNDVTVNFPYKIL